MALSNFLAQKYGAGIVMDTLDEKYPPLVKFLDSLDDPENDLPKCFVLWFLAHKQFVLDQVFNPHNVIKLNEAKVDWDSYTKRLLTEKPPIKVILELLHEIGICEIAGIDVGEFVTTLTTFKNK